MTALLVLLLQAEPPLDFKRDVRPLLSDLCFNCHGPDAGKRKGELRLDRREDAFAKRGDSPPAFVAGKPDLSDALRRMTSADPDEKMPPPKSPKQPTAKQIAVLRRWIAEGGAWSEHWAFIPPQRPTVPAAKSAARTPIDRFVFARLEREGLAPSPEADRATWLRRLSLDLTGLPPTPSELDAFLASGDREKEIERLLASPHYGERWARVWLDAARYADSDGYEKDKSREVWFYRDWVIDAINRDLPYDRFIVEQIAGDLLPGATQDQVVATGFLRNSMINEEGGVDPEQFRMEAMFDRMDAIGKSVLGLTIQCAQCHTHKYDPITHEDYYRLFAFLNNAHEASAVVYTADERKKREEILKAVAEIETALKLRAPDWEQRLAGRRPRAEWTVLRPEVDDISTGGQKYLPKPDGSFLAQGYAPTKHRAKMTVKVDLESITGFRLELLTDPDLPRGGPGRSVTGTAALTEFEVEAAPAADPSKRTKLKLVRATADFDPAEEPLHARFDDKSKKRRVTGPVAFAIDGKDETAWGTDAGPGRRNRARHAVFVPEKPVEFPGGAVLTFYLKQNHGGWNSDDNMSHNLGRLRLSVTASPDPEADPAASDAFAAFRRSVPEWAEENARIEGLWRDHPEGSSQLALIDRADPRTTSMLDRGDFLKPTKAVTPGVPGFLHPLPAGAPPNRLGLALWLTDRNSPVTARAFVNRVWQSWFGTGLVATPEDLGSQAEAPSHPELLDWLAVEFMDSGWSLKKLNRLIASSAVTAQSSRVSPALLAKDPYNRLLSRGPRFRVDAEGVRDVALAAAGLLNPKVGGPSVFPPAPASLFVPPASYGPKHWIEDQGDGKYRRAMYTFRYRSVPYPALQAFDAPNGDFSCVRRPRSNTPLQALTTLNEPLFVECAKALGARAVREGGATDADRAAYAFRLCTGRAPDASEREVLLAFLEKRKSAPGLRPAEAAGASAAQAGLDAWSALGRVLLNLDETITKE
jgi:hypothetical protein